MYSVNRTPLGTKKRFSLERFLDQRSSVCAGSIESRTQIHIQCREGSRLQRVRF